MVHFENKAALVTGGGSGIGLEISRRLVALGLRVVLHSRTDSAARAAAKLGMSFVQGDLADSKQTDQLCESAIAQVGQIDILVNNAGYQHIADLESFPEYEWSRMQKVMLQAPFHLSQKLIPGMKAIRWGRIINIASTQGLTASPFKSGYVAAKHGLIGLTRAMAVELGGYGITVNAICPAYVRTPLALGQIRDQARTLGIPEEDIVPKVMLAPAAIKRLIEPAEISELVSYLVSPEADAISGSIWAMDGGWTSR